MTKPKQNKKPCPVTYQSEDGPQRPHLENWCIFCWNPSLTPALKFLPARKRKKPQDKGPSMRVLSLQETACAITFLFFSPPPTSSFTGYCLLNSKAMGCWQLAPGYSPEPVPRAAFSLTSQWAKAAQPRLSYCFFCAKPFLVSLCPAFISVSS